MPGHGGESSSCVLVVPVISWAACSTAPRGAEESAGNETRLPGTGLVEIHTGSGWKPRPTRTLAAGFQ